MTGGTPIYGNPQMYLFFFGQRKQTSTPPMVNKRSRVTLPSLRTNLIRPRLSNSATSLAATGVNPAMVLMCFQYIESNKRWYRYGSNMQEIKCSTDWGDYCPSRKQITTVWLSKILRRTTCTILHPWNTDTHTKKIERRSQECLFPTMFNTQVINNCLFEWSPPTDILSDRYFDILPDILSDILSLSDNIWHIWRFPES